jgi:hypothetical protein
MAVKFKRRRLWVDPAFQFRLLVRMSLYFLLFLVTLWHVGFVLAVRDSVAANGLTRGLGDLYLDYLWQERSLLWAALFITPVILYDQLKFSHRIAGPLYRVRRVMRDMAAGLPVTEFTPREKDLMRELFHDFNTLVKAWNARAEPGRNGRVAAESPAGMTTEAIRSTAEPEVVGGPWRA